MSEPTPKNESNGSEHPALVALDRAIGTAEDYGEGRTRYTRAEEDRDAAMAEIRKLIRGAEHDRDYAERLEAQQTQHSARIAELERHRMTPEEREALRLTVTALEDVAKIGQLAPTSPIQALRAYLDRTEADHG